MVKKAPKPQGATLTIDVDSFVRTRDSVVTGLATLQDAIQTLSSAYIKHTNAVLGDNGAAIDINTAMNAMNGQFNNPLLGGSIHGLERPASPTNSVTGGEKDKKERKKRLHDPNAPKRPLTAYFLFMQTARPIIAQDLGEETTKGAISKEGTTRWTNMTNGQKRQWIELYQKNLRLYHARMHAYDKGNGRVDAKDMNDDEALEYAVEHAIPEPIAAEQKPDAPISGEEEPLAIEEAVAAVAEKEMSDEAEEEEAVLPPPVKTPKSKGRKGKVFKAVAEEEAEPHVSSSAILPPAKKEKEKEKEKEISPDKKRKRSSKRNAEEPVEEEAQVVETPKSVKPRKKKTKSEA